MDHLEVLINAIQHEPILLNKGLSTNKEDLLEEFNIKITRKGIILHVDMGPKSSEGHDYMFTINTLTGKIDSNSIAIGEVLPDPEES